LATGGKALNVQLPGNPPDSIALSRRTFMKLAGAFAAAGIINAAGLWAMAEDTVEFPFANGQRRIVNFPEKNEMILLRTRPPLLETPFEVFDQGVFTPNNRFFVRWHLPVIPTTIDVNTFRLRVDGHVQKPVEFTLDEILKEFRPVELAAINQCSGNSRGFFSPRVPGGEWGNGAMGNAMWTGIRLKDLLERAGVMPGAVQVRFRGLDSGEVPETPVFMKSLSLDHAMDGQVMVAYGMNGTQLPVLNGFPLRLVVPGWYSTYWVKMLTHIEVLEQPDDNFWMHTAYLIPDTPGASMTPGETGVKMVPINRMVPRSFITNLESDVAITAGHRTEVRGIAFGGNAALKEVAFSADGGAHWQPATLGKDFGRYSFRQWHSYFTSKQKGPLTLMVRATNANGETQPATPNWNTGGYMRNVVEQIMVRAL
jgi:DMSO/TMAO reductase YedYZ molybdopterin-dependent catalytic subunit